MLFVISAVYVLTNLTTLVLVFLRAAISETVATLSPAADAIFRLFYMSFLINCAVNPIIYNFYDRNFRKECFRMLSFSRK
ncbi:unnamed protein product [Lymnaea stagnalis]|uniref:G-protein coupled receptors family 1 profile domain-containing protein n=1 Tax=Lymnaea stagnalis TaxID=6523 RepID=A0AAV2I9E7_LYMST